MLAKLANLLHAWGINRSDLLLGSCGLLVLAIALKWGYSVVLSKTKSRVKGDSSLTIDVAKFSQEPPPLAPMLLDFYGIPMRLSAIVAAPAGRASNLPLDNQSLLLQCESALPRLGRIAELHKTKIIRWPTQLSVTGFTHALLREASLPDGKQTRSRWTVVTGPVEAETPSGTIGLQEETGTRLLTVALFLCAEEPNAYNQEAVPAPHQWRRILQVRDASRDGGEGT